ncbi:MAG: DUF5655 domain-containing protein [Chloroflexi bacterium]|nr:DUF5655 domain-containing protein [Chloroflexota bacterium]
MAKEAREIEQNFIATLSEETGADLQAWLQTLKATGLQKNNEIVKWLKSEQGFNHMQATLLSGIYLNDGASVYHYPTLFRKLFTGKEQQRPLYDAIVAAIQAEIPATLFIPTKTYVSLEDQRVFGCAKINQTNIRLGLDLGDEPFGDYLRKGVGLGAMPNITHMIELNAESAIDASLAHYARQAYERAHHN